MAKAIFGLQKPDSGCIRIHGEEAAIHSVRDAIHRGIGYLTEDRTLRGLCLSLSVRDNLVSPSMDRFTAPTGIVNDREIDRYAGGMVERYSIVTPSIHQTMVTLSGGNQQKVLLGMWLGIQPAVFIADEPTKGVDVGAKEEIYRHINDLAARGVAVMLISSDLNELLGMSDRICVMRDGHIQKILPADEATEEVIISYALGAGEVMR